MCFQFSFKSLSYFELFFVATDFLRSSFETVKTQAILSSISVCFQHMIILSGSGQLVTIVEKIYIYLVISVQISPSLCQDNNRDRCRVRNF
jgi:hypothetical protein